MAGTSAERAPVSVIVLRLGEHLVDLCGYKGHRDTGGRPSSAIRLTSAFAVSSLSISKTLWSYWLDESGYVV